MKQKQFDMTRAIRLCFAHAPVAACAKVFLGVTTGALTPILVLVVASFLNRALAFTQGGGGITPMILSIVWMALGYAYGQLAQVLIRRADASLESALRAKLRPALVRKQARVPYVLLENPRTLDLATNVCENAEKRFLSILDDSIQIIRLLIQVCGTLSLFIARLWWMLPLYLLVGALIFFVSHRGGKAIYAMDVASTKLTRMLYYLSGVLTSRETAAERTLFGYTDRVNEAFSRVHLRRSNMVTKEIAVEEGYINLSGLLLNLLALGAVFGLLKPLQVGTLSHGLYVSLIGAMIGLNRLIAFSFARLMRDIASHRAFLRDCARFLALPEEAKESDAPDAAFERLEIRNLRFRYASDGAYVLDGVNLTIERGESYSLIGRNGAGKSTLTKILLGLYRDFEGDIRINGVDIARYSARQLRGMFSIAYQDFARYPVSLRGNIALGRDSSDFDRAVRLAALSEVVERLPMGAETPLGKLFEGGVDLSGGEWQKVAIARALYADAPFLILDEPTASLSPMAESRLYRRFQELAAGKTSLLISHRLGSTKLSDTLFVLEGGKVAEAGSHEALMAADGIYAEMFRGQRSWYDAQ